MKKWVVVCLGVLAVVLVCGCIGMRGPSDEELIANTMTTWQEAIMAPDVETLMATYSEEYETSEVPDKESMRQFMEMIADQGYLDDMEVSMEEAETVIDGETATVSPVEIGTAMGSMTIEFTLQKEDGAWLIVNSESST